ncbi:MAG TPA: diacylglycerol kinase [Noviherbaspirillum sp.]|nr:diacylglycerol kinase [Noviherbaspirillum sp.]
MTRIKRLHTAGRKSAPPAASQAPSTGAAGFKSTGGLGRILRATRYSLSGLRAAWRVEAAFRQEVVLGVAMLVLVPWLAPSLVFGVLMAGSILLVWGMEMLNSAIEALADAISSEHHPLLGRAKDLGSAAVMFCLLLCALVWGAALYLRFFS